jgi:hypothetical protein
MGYAIGISLATVVAGFGRWSGFDRDRAFYPTLLVVIAGYYVLFAAMSGSGHALVAESLAMVVFAALAVAGFRFSSWLVVAGLAGHGVFDALHGHVVANPGVPEWWPAFCLAFDVGAAGVLAISLVRSGRA